MLKKNQFTFVEYNRIPYPEEYQADLRECAAHFDKVEIEKVKAYSMHTEYSYGKRKFDSSLLMQYPALKGAHRDGVPQLWKSAEWAAEFADFLIQLTEGRSAPSVIEIHPPFQDYCTINEFTERYRLFERRIHSVFPGAEIVLENRSGTVYRGGKFLVGKACEIADLCNKIQSDCISLGLVLDFPQLLTAEHLDPEKFKKEKYNAAIKQIAQYKELIRGIHIWGKKKSATGRWVAHCGTLDTYFSEKTDDKAHFLAGIEEICCDGETRYLVPEVNSGERDLAAIMKDLFSE